MSDDTQELSEKLISGEKLTEEQFINIARERFELAAEAEATSRMEELDDEKFMVGDQWPLNVKSDRLRDNRPCLTVNQIPQFVRQITNDQRQNRPAIKVNPIDEKADFDTAKVLEGIVRHIEYASCADIAVDTAFECAVRSGLGYFGLTTDYADSRSFKQEIKFRQFKDRKAVYTDPYWECPDGSDMQWGFIVSDPSRDEFTAEYPDSDASSIADWESLGESPMGWFTKSTCRVAEYYYKTYEECDLCLLSDDTEVEKEDIDKLPDGLPDGITIVSERKGIKTSVYWAKINGLEILDQTKIHGEYIPIFPVIGEEYMLDNKKVYAGIVRNLKDPQRMYNYFASAETEAIALAPKAPFIGAKGQFEGAEDKWQQANTKNQPYLEYNTISINGTPAPPPQRNVTEPAVMAITQAMQLRAQEMKATTGIYDPMLGKQNNELSGIAIQRRINQSGTATFHYSDNLSRTQRHAGRVMLNWIPKVYKGKQAIRIIGDDGEVDFAKINQIFEEDDEQMGHFLDAGKYDCAVSTGPSYQTRRQEAVASMLDLARSMPQTMQMAMDLLVRNMDWPGSQEIADRLKKMLPPQLADDKSKLDPQTQAQMTHMSQMVQQLTQQNQELMQMINMKKVEYDSKERIEYSKQQTDLTIEYMKHHAKDSQMQFETEVQMLQQRLQQANTLIPGSGGDAGNPQNMATGAPSPGQSMGVQ